MMYFLDTNICIYLLKGTFPNLEKKVLATPPSKIKIPSMVAAELLYGAWKSQKALETMEKIGRFLKPLKIIPFDMEAAGYYGKVRAGLEQSGKMIGFNDMVIVATVLAYNGVLVTHNGGEFSRIEGLVIENWTQG
ncbi:MAG: type II toxin-antitoxin system VapC family toxin [Treponema sp.]|jgi:tRNA(fMet)-specific endonuclease VapC|nr:type II toxin-antitoxin system VapC family toxin [Treponema sp.]